MKTIKPGDQVWVRATYYRTAMTGTQECRLKHGDHIYADDDDIRADEPETEPGEMTKLIWEKAEKRFQDAGRLLAQYRERAKKAEQQVKELEDMVNRYKAVRGNPPIEKQAIRDAWWRREEAKQAADINTWKTIVGNLEKMNADLRERAEKAEAELAQCESTIQHWSDQAEAARADLADADARIERVEQLLLEDDDYYSWDRIEQALRPSKPTALELLERIEASIDPYKTTADHKNLTALRRILESTKGGV